jgi:tRNA-intron endonuclease
MHGSLEGDTVHIPSPGRERFYDNRGYGHPRGNALALAPVEAAHLLFRGDLETVDDMGFRSFLATTETLVPFLVYKDLRERGFYLSPAREGWIGSDEARGADFVVYPRGKGPWDGTIEYCIRVVGERETVPVDALESTLAVVDEESEITYLSVESPDMTGTTDHDLPTNVRGTLLSDRVVLWDPPATLYEQAFYGQPLDTHAADGQTGSIQCSLVEAVHLADRGIIQVDAGLDGVIERGRAVEGERFERRRAVYSALRGSGIVPKTGYKFGADFRTYVTVEGVDDLGHSEHLVRVLPREHSFSPRDLSLDVRLAHGVRKRMVFALTDTTGEIDWRSVSRLTP